MICLPSYLRFLTVFDTLLGGWIGYELSKVNLGSSIVLLFLIMLPFFWFCVIYTFFFLLGIFVFFIVRL
jgi:hypothetical protein